MCFHVEQLWGSRTVQTAHHFPMLPGLTIADGGRFLDSGRKCLHGLEALPPPSPPPQSNCISIHFSSSQVNSVVVITFLCNLSKTERAIYSVQIQWENATLCDSAGLCSSSEALSSPASEEGGEIPAQYICCS